MNRYFDQIHQIRRDLLTDQRLGHALGALKTLLGSQVEMPVSDFQQRVEDVGTNYQLMKDYLLKGVKDQQQSKVYNQLLVRLFKLTQDIEMRLLTQTNGVFAQAFHHSRHADLQTDDIKSHLEGFVQDLAMLSLETSPAKEEERRRIYEAHQRYMNMLFETLLVSPQWSDGVRDSMTEILLSPTIDGNNAQLMISAMMLSNMNVFDANKFFALKDVYLRTPDEHIRQRALVGWAFSMPSYLQREQDILGVGKTVRELVKDEHVQRDLLELQMQVFYCKNTERDFRAIEKDILPNIMKNNNFQITRFGLTEKEEDSLEEILNPGAADQRTEEMEAAINKIIDLQKKGTDIYFGGFSQMKRFPFFNELSNWFVPFYAEHPGLQHVSNSELSWKILHVLYEEGPFCDSDEYSFALGLSHVLQNLPPGVRELLGDPDAIGHRVSVIEKNSPTYIRRMYLQNLYRFFRIYPQRAQLLNPFDYEEDSDYNPYFFTNVLLASLPEAIFMELEKFLMKQKLYRHMTPICRALEETDDPEQMIIAGYVAMQSEEYARALQWFRSAIGKQPDSLQALKGIALTSFNTKDFESAEHAYQQLVRLKPDNLRYRLGLCISQISNGHEDTGVSGLYKLNYEYPDDLNVMRSLAWGLMSVQKNEQADVIYQKLLAAEKPLMMDYLNAGYCKWFLGRHSEGIFLFKSFIAEASPEDPRERLEAEFQKDRNILDVNQVSSTEQHIIVDLVCE